MPFTLPLYVGIILVTNNQVLLVKRHNTDWASGKWNFPGGLLEENETLLQAAIRETEEETGVVVQPNDFELMHVLQVRKSVTNTKDIIGIYFKAEKWHGNATNKEPNKHSDIGWFSLDALPEKITEHVKLAIEGLKTGKRYSVN